MANQGCPHEGKDSRLFGRWGCRIQSALSFHTTMRPIEVLFRFPPYVALIVPISRGRWFSVRIGFRYDPHWPYDDGTGRTGGYIFPEAIVKVMDHKVY